MESPEVGGFDLRNPRRGRFAAWNDEIIYQCRNEDAVIPAQAGIHGVGMRRIELHISHTTNPMDSGSALRPGMTGVG